MLFPPELDVLIYEVPAIAKGFIAMLETVSSKLMAFVN